MDPQRFIVHVGKSAGASLRLSLSPDTAKATTWVHIRQPRISEVDRYIIVTRAPIARALSAFNWRYHLVVETAEQPDRFPGERDVLLHYKTLEALAEALYFEDGSDNALAQGNFRSIHHLGESTAFYLERLLGTVRQGQIEGVIAQESLAADALRVLGTTIAKQSHVHRPNTPPRMLNLSVQARKNLRRFLHRDFACMTVLQDWGMLSDAASAALTREMAI